MTRGWGGGDREFSFDKGVVSGLFLCFTCSLTGYVVDNLILWIGAVPPVVQIRKRACYKEALYPNEQKHCENATGLLWKRLRNSLGPQ